MKQEKTVAEKKRDHPKKQVWTSKDLNYLRSSTGKKSVQEIAQELGRPVSHIRAVICMLRLAGSSSAMEGIYR